MGIVYVFTIAFLCSTGIIAVWGAFERFILNLIKARREKKEREAKRAVAKEFFKDFHEHEKNRVLVTESTLWVKEIEYIFADRDNTLKTAERGSYFEKF